MALADWLVVGSIIAGAGAIAPVIVEAWRRSTAPDKPSPGGSVDIEAAQERISATSMGQLPPSLEDQKASFERLLDFNDRFGVRFIVSTLPPPKDQPFQHSITQEEVEAAESVSRVLPRSRTFSLHLETADKVDLRCSDNLIVLGSKRKNKVAAEFSRFLKDFDIDFVQILYDDEEERWGLSFGGQTYASPLFDQQREYKKDPTYRDRAGFIDYGLVAKLTNPWNDEAKVLYIAGVKSLGTLGAGKFLEENGPWLEGKVGNSNFAQLVKVVREDPSKDHISVEAVGEPRKLSDLISEDATSEE
jgi:hypothetical protein